MRLLNQKDFHNAKYINWQSEAEQIELDIIEYNKKLLEIRNSLTRVKVLEGDRTLRDKFPNKTYDEYVPKKYRKKQYRIYCRINNKYYIYMSHRFGKTIKKDEKTRSPYDVVVEKFRERTGLGERCMYNAFGTTEYEFRKCVPIPLCYFNPIYSSSDNYRNELQSVSSIDGCSQYPTALCDLLPDAKTAVTYNGTVKPNEEYKFAFYLKSGHTAVYNEFDTHDWEKHLWAPIIFRQKKEQVSLDDDITILMKESKYNFRDEMEYFFNIKESYPKNSEERDQAKLVLVAFIGTMWMNVRSAYEKRKFAHIVAIAQARALQKMLNQLDKIYYKDVIHICVDGIIYKGKEKLGTNERKLGNFEQEFLNAKMMIREYNTYVVKQDNKVIKSKHGCYNIFTDGTVINELTDYNQLFDLARTDNSSDYDLITEYKENKI